MTVHQNLFFIEVVDYHKTQLDNRCKMCIASGTRASASPAFMYVESYKIRAMDDASTSSTLNTFVSLCSCFMCDEEGGDETLPYTSCTQTYVHTQIHTHIYTNTHTHTHIHIHTHTHRHTLTHTHMNIYTVCSSAGRFVP